MSRTKRLVLSLPLVCLCWPTLAAEQELNGHRFQLPDGFQLELAASQPLVDRPITAAFDELGRLYVADSSGSNDKVEKQLAEKPHRILRLEDLDGDGRFDKSALFADRMMFPEGTLWHAGSLYVAAPPSIWKLTDTDDDGVADQREEWFQGKTLTGCANDLHGPYLGRDGWIYWCKGAFAEQTYERPGRSPWSTRAAHIFRRHPDGGTVEPVMAGGMDNPVDVVFTPSGERIFTTTFLQHPRGGQRDGLIHAIYGGLYGKVHSVIEGHPRTGPLMPTLVHYGAAAPCGLELLESNQFGSAYQHNVFAALFNMQRVTRHVVRKSGASFETTDEDFLVSEDIDFHPTDLIEDADGSLLVVDTGGWYKLCCPTSQLYKPDILGAIYRIRRTGAHVVDDPRGVELAWDSLDTAQLAELLQDARPPVRSRAEQRLRELGGEAVPPLAAAVRDATEPEARLRAVWVLARLATAPALAAVRGALADNAEEVRQAAAHVAGLHRDPEAVPPLLRLLASGTPHNQRAAAEALGRIGDPRAIPPLLRTDAGGDRILDHSLTYAVIEINDASAAREGLASEDVGVRRRSLIAADQMESGGLAASEVEPLLKHESRLLRDTAWWLVERRPEWAPDLANYFRELVAGAPSPAAHETLSARLPALLGDAQLRRVMGRQLSSNSVSSSVKRTIVEGAAQSALPAWPAEWPSAEMLSSGDEQLAAAVIGTLYQLSDSVPEPPVAKRLVEAAASAELSEVVRLKALAVAARRQNALDLETVRFVCEYLASDQPPERRAMAVDILLAGPHSEQALLAIIAAVPGMGVMELSRLIELFQELEGESLGLAFVAALEQCPATAALPSERLVECLQQFDGSVASRREQLVARIEADTSEKRTQLENVFGLLGNADIRRGQAIFNSTRASCRACHEMGYLGGDVGPDLTRIGGIRTERDLLEAILFPSISFVRSYEPTDVITTSGQVFSGVVVDETNEEIVLALDAQKKIRLQHGEIEERRPGSVSVMPAGLEKQLSNQELADLVKFLRASR